MFSDLMGKAKPRRRTADALVFTAVAMLAIGLSIFLGARPLSAANTEHQNSNTFLVYGSVRDTEGRPMAEVEVVVSSGNGTLRRTGAGKTMTDGTFAVNFSPGLPALSTDPEVSKNRRQTGAGSGQAAVVRAWKKGYYEVELSRSGGLWMADFLQEGEDDSIFTVGNTVLPDQPFHVSFVLASAAQVSGRLVDSEGKPLPDKEVTLNGDTLPPAQNVLDSAKTDEDGQFLFTEVPLRPYWFEVNETKSEVLPFKESGEYRVALMYSDGKSPTLAVELQSFLAQESTNSSGTETLPVEENPKYTAVVAIAKAQWIAVDQARRAILAKWGDPRVGEPREARTITIPLGDQDRTTVLKFGCDCLGESRVDWKGVFIALGPLSNDVSSKAAVDFVAAVFSHTWPPGEPGWQAAISNGLHILGASDSRSARNILFNWATLALQDPRKRKFFPMVEVAPNFDAEMMTTTMHSYLYSGPIDAILPFARRVAKAHGADSPHRETLEHYISFAERVAAGDTNGMFAVE